jgi:hypothetical protein
MPVQSYPQVIHLFRRKLLINPFSPVVVFCYNESGEEWGIMVKLFDVRGKKVRPS